jgi:uncharacterized membrane protein YdjX (TVP38/TMEM64 family)
MGRLLLVAILAAAIAAFFVFDLGRFLSFAELNANKARLQAAVAETPVLSALAFGLTYVAVTALSLPVATALSLLSGALFGRLFGTAIVDLSATAGAALSFLSARYLLRDWVERRMAAAPDPSWDPDGPRARRARRRLAAWRTASEGIRTHGFNYLLVLRLLPVAPFFLINLVSGLTSMPVRTFVLGTLIGILPGTFLYVNAGTALGTLTRPADLLSVQVVGALALLGLFALIPVAWSRWRKA